MVEDLNKVLDTKTKIWTVYIVLPIVMMIVGALIAVSNKAWIGAIIGGIIGIVLSVFFALYVGKDLKAMKKESYEY